MGLGKGVVINNTQQIIKQIITPNFIVLKVRFAFVYVLLNLFAVSSFGQLAKDQCQIKNFAFDNGEIVTYHAYYNWHFIWINAGLVKFSVQDKVFEDKESYFISAYGRTYTSYDKLMKVRDTFEVYLEKDSFLPLQFNRVTKEGSTESHHIYNFNYQNNTIQSKIRREDKTFYKDSIQSLPNCTYDLLSMVYKARNINFSNYKKGDKIPIRMIVDGKIHDLYIRYLGKEEVENRDGRLFKCLKFSPLLVPGTIFKSGEGMTVWITDDKNRIPIIVEAKVIVGSVKAVFVSAEGLKHPIESEVLE